MTIQAFAESVVEQATFGWLESVGWSVQHGVEVAPGELATERSDYGQIALEHRLSDMLPRLISGELRVQDAERFVREMV